MDEPMDMSKTKSFMFFSRFHHMSIYFHFFVLFSYLLRTAFSSDSFSNTYVPTENIALDCGSFDLHSLFYDGRNWTNDVRSEFVAYQTDSDSTTVSTATSLDSSVPEVPYKTARVFKSNFTYSFNVTLGPKFVRLYFYPGNSFPNLNFSRSFMTVSSGKYSLLRNFSALSTANYMNSAYIFREFVIHVENHTLDLTFSPSSKDPDVFAFVNGIEIVSMPEKLYIDSNKRLSFVGYPAMAIWLDNVTALETVYRIDVGGPYIAPKQDTGMFRAWTNDRSYIFGGGFDYMPYDLDTSVKYSPSVPAYTAPENVYRTSRSMTTYSQVNTNYNLSWFFPVDTGFIYLVRIHFCQVFRLITKVNQQVFDIYINNQTAQESFDIIAWAGGYEVPTYKDYAVSVSGNEERQDIWLELHPYTESKSEYYDASLNGVEIFKISNYDGNLAGLNPSFSESRSPVMPLPFPSISSSKKKVLLIFGCLFGAIVLVVLLFSLLTRRLKKPRQRQTQRQKTKSELSHHFSLNEIKAATNNFDEALVIGSGSFGVVYKGNIKNTVAIKRANEASTEKASYQYRAEIAALSKLHHHNIVALLGYCNEENETIVVYEYMSNGSLFDLLHAPGKQSRSPLAWIQRLDICVGAARGLHYLHTGINPPIIHRDIKTANILVDNDWTAKVSDFGLSKLCPSEETNSNNDHLSINIRGSVGYMDPEYYRRRKLTEKSDVYSFGVVLLEVVSARHVLNVVAEDDGDNNEDEESFVEWALKCVHTGEMNQLIDPHLRGTITAASLAKFLEVARKCLEDRCEDRPLMNEVVCSLELALQLQESEPDESDVFNGDKVLDININTLNNSDVLLGVEFSELMVPVGR